MGSEVVDGFVCKPKKLDPTKPIMHFKTQIFICNDERCSNAHKNKDIAKNLRDILKDLKLDKGKNRIKISRSGCFGACRFRGVANIYENTRANGYLKNNNIWLQQTHLYTIEQWKELFIMLSENKDIQQTNFKQIPISKQDEYEY